MTPSRFIKASVLAFATAASIGGIAAPAFGQNSPNAAGLTPDQSLKRLIEGNQRFASGKATQPRQDLNRVKETAKGQKPFAIVVGCSDSRVPNEIIFDEGVGDLFIVRTAGQVSAAASYGSMEFAHAALGANLIMVLGHTACGAVDAAVKRPEVPGHIVTLINEILPAVERSEKAKGDRVTNAIRENVKYQVEKLRKLEPVLAKAVREKKIRIVGGVYNLENGKVEMVIE